MRVAFFHGLESAPHSDKNVALDSTFDFVYAPPMDYTDAGLFDRVLKQVQNDEIDLLIGSSMGGYFAYCISTITGIPTLIFNPAVQGRSMEPKVKYGSKRAIHTVVLGRKDDVIDPNKSIEWFDKNGIGRFRYTWESNAHRIPINIFTKWITNMKPKMMKTFKTYSEFLNEMKITAEHYAYKFTVKGRLIEAHFHSIDTKDDYEISFSPWKRNEIVVEFSSKLLKSDLYSKSSPLAVAKIISTVFTVMRDYINTYNPNSILTFIGSDDKRTRIYGMLLKSNPVDDMHWKTTDDGGFAIALKTTTLSNI